MSVITLNVDEARRTLSSSDKNVFVINDKNVDIVRFALMTGFADVALDEHSALRVMYQRPGETEVRAQTLTYYDTDGIRKLYDWELLSADLVKSGTLNCALCILRTDTEVEEWHTTPYQIRVLGSIHTDDSDEGDESITPTVVQRVAVLESMIQRVASGAPIVVSSAAAMTETDRIYVLTTDGKWYYYDGSAWTVGGEYGGVLAGSITTDKLADGAVKTAKIADGAVTAGKIASGVVPAVDSTLTQTGAAADAKAAGDRIATISLSTGYETITPTENNKYIDLSGSSVTMSGGVPQYSGSSATYSCSIYACRENDKFIINGAGGNQTRLWGFISSTGTILGVAQTMASATGLMIVAPKDTAYLITHTSDGRVSFKEGWININSKVNNLNANVGRYGVYTLSESDIEQGGTSDGKRVYSATRLRTGISISVKAGDVIRFTGGTTITDASITRYDTNGGFITTGGYASSHNYKMPADGFVLINYKNSANASITPSQYDATTQVISERGIALESCEDGVLSAKVKMILTSDNNIEVVNNGASLQLIGTSCYVLGLKTGARKLVTYADIASQIPTYCTTNDRGLLIAMPNNGVFGYDIKSEQFVMKTGEVAAYAISDSFTPLYYRYYNTVFGDLVDRYIYKKVINTVESKTIVRQSFNSAYHEGVTDFATKCSQFCFLMYGDGVVDVDAPTDIEPFLFFTDPHLVMFSGWEDAFCEKLACIQKYYNSTPTSFCLCGGDWLGTSDLPSEACFKMGYIDGVMRSMFDNSYMLVGNHDTNYIGKLTPESEQYTTSLSNECIANLWYRKNRKAYFKFEGDATAFYCFDTGVEAQQLSSQNNYGYTQLEWFANSLLTEEKTHIAVAAHILFYNNEQALQPLTDQVLSIAQAYNSRGSISVNNVLYDFGTTTGKIEFGLFGHTHSDYNGVIKGIPCIITTNVMRAISPTFDLILADYTNRVLHMVRVGEGSDRNISLS